MSYFIFYGVTYFGSALTSVSSFFMIERLSGRVEDLGIALALKTAFMAVASPYIARRLGRLKASQGFWLSQIAGPLLLLPLIAGVVLHNQTIFLIGVAIGGVPNLILNMAGTAYFKMESRDDLATFKRNQGKLQLVIGACFSTAALVTPWMLKYLGYEALLALDLLSYVAGAFFVARLARNFDESDRIGVPAVVPAVPPSTRPGYFRALVVGGSIIMIYLLRGLPPMVAGHAKLTADLHLDATMRQTLWFFEAIAGVLAGFLYARARGWLERIRFFETGMLSGLWLLIAVAFPSYGSVALMIFVLSLSMTLSFMRVRDDYVASHGSRAETLRATGFVNMVMNAILTASPLLIGFASERFSVGAFIATIIGVQVVAYVLLRYFRDTGASSNLALKIQDIGSKTILTFLLFICAALTVLLHSTEKHKAEQQMEIWIQNITRSVVPQLVDGDYVPIYGKLKLLQQTELFDRFQVFDTKQRPVASFVNKAGSSNELHEIRDEVGSVWGYYSYAPNKLYWWTSLSIVLPMVLASILLIGILARVLLRKTLRAETDAIERFVAGIERHAASISESGVPDTGVSLARDGRDINELRRIGIVIDKMAAQIRERQARLFDQELEAASARRMADLSNQVAHDIRSPLTALNMVIATVPHLSEDKRMLIKNSAQRINDIANDLLSRSKSSTGSEHANQPVLVSAVVDSVLSEKRIQFRDVAGLRLGAELNGAFGLFAHADHNQLQRALSNLINNSVEAMKAGGGRVTLAIEATGQDLFVRVTDDGVGIPADILSRVADQGFSFGKEDGNSGSGLGLSQVRKSMTRMGGDVRITSREGFGTTVELKLRACPPPSWFASRIACAAGQLVVSVDDEVTIHQIWRERLATEEVQLLDFTTTTGFVNFMERLVGERPLVLADHDFGPGQMSGLELVERFRHRAEFVLVTSHADEPALQRRCAELGVKLLPKSLSGLVPIHGISRANGASAIS